MEPLGARAELEGLQQFLSGVARMEAAMDGFARATDKAGKEGDSFKAKTVAIGTAIGAGVAGAAAAATSALVNLAQSGFGLLTDFIGQSIQASGEAAKVQAQLGAVLKSTGGVAGVTAQQVNDLATSLMDLTGIDDEAIGGAENLLLTFTRIGADIFPRTTAVVLDLATAMGTDLNSAALMVGKALNDPIAGLTALNRAGVQFSDGQKETIKRLVETGQAAKAQQIILAELERQVGGSAEAFGNTLPGAIAKAQNKFENLQQSIGDALAPIGVVLAQRLSGAIDMAQAEIDKLTADGTLRQWSVQTAALLLVIIDNVIALGKVFGTTLGYMARIALSVGKIIYLALQWINPFARHSPSLVDQVEVGVDQIVDAYASILRIKGPIEGAGRAIERLGEAAGKPGKKGLDDLKTAADEAKAVVDDLTRSISDAERKIGDLADTNIDGEKAIDDQTFALEQQRKQAQLTVLQLKKAGASKEAIDAAEKAVDDISNELDILRLQGEITFDPLHRAIDDLAKPVNELPFDEITRQIKDQQDIIAQAKDKLGPATEAYNTLALAVEQVSKRIDEAGGGGGGGGLDSLLGGLPGPEDIPDFKQWLADMETARAGYDAQIGPLFDDLIANLDEVNRGLDRWATNTDTQLGNMERAIQAWGTVWDLVMKPIIDKNHEFWQDLILIGKAIDAMSKALGIQLPNPFGPLIAAAQALELLLRKIRQLQDAATGKKTTKEQDTDPNNNNGEGDPPVAGNSGEDGDTTPGARAGQTAAITTTPLSQTVMAAPRASMGAGNRSVSNSVVVNTGPVGNPETAHALAYRINTYQRRYVVPV